MQSRQSQSHLNEGFACVGVYSNEEFVCKAQRNFNTMELEMLEEGVDLPSVEPRNMNNSWN